MADSSAAKAECCCSSGSAATTTSSSASRRRLGALRTSDADLQTARPFGPRRWTLRTGSGTEPGAAGVAAPPAWLDLTGKLTPVRDQGDRGTCVAMASACAKEYQESALDPARRLSSGAYLSPEFVFARRADPHVDGMSFYDAGTILRREGICREATAPYGDAASARSSAAAAEAAVMKIAQFSLVPGDASALRAAIASCGPVVAVCNCYDFGERFWAPKAAGASPLGGHAVALVGYDSLRSTFRLRNSWGPSWGSAGYVDLPAADLPLISELWAIEDAASPAVPPLPSPSDEPPSPPPEPDPTKCCRLL